MKIKLTKGLFAKIDDSDYDKISGYKFHANKSGKNFYARTYIDGKPVTMAEIILGVRTDLYNVIDHINRNTLDNRKENIRYCSKSQNQMNRYDDIKGYYFDKRTGKHIVQIRANKQRYVKRFKAKDEAIEHLRGMYPLLHGEFSSVGQN